MNFHMNQLKSPFLTKDRIEVHPWKNEKINQPIESVCFVPWLSLQIPILNWHPQISSRSDPETSRRKSTPGSTSRKRPKELMKTKGKSLERTSATQHAKPFSCICQAEKVESSYHAVQSDFFGPSNQKAQWNIKGINDWWYFGNSCSCN